MTAVSARCRSDCIRRAGVSARPVVGLPRRGVSVIPAPHDDAFIIVSDTKKARGFSVMATAVMLALGAVPVLRAPQPATLPAVPWSSSVLPIGTPLHPHHTTYRAIGPSAPCKAMPTGRAYRSTEARRQRPQEALGRAGPAGNSRARVRPRQRGVVARGVAVSACSLAWAWVAGKIFPSQRQSYE